MKNQGFTIIELMIAVLVAAITLTLGVPSFVSSIQNNRLTSQLNSLIGSLNYARSEAVKLGLNNVTICGSSNGSSCNTSSWESGWIIFSDGGVTGTVDGSDQVLRIESTLSGSNTLRAYGFGSTAFVSFDKSGMVSSTGSLILCDSRDAEEAKAIVINLSGQSRIATDDDANSKVDVHDEKDVVCPTITI